MQHKQNKGNHPHPNVHQNTTTSREIPMWNGVSSEKTLVIGYRGRRVIRRTAELVVSRYPESLAWWDGLVLQAMLYAAV